MGKITYLTIPDDTTFVVRIDGKIVSCDDEPRCLVLNKYDSVCVFRVEPVFDVRVEL